MGTLRVPITRIFVFQASISSIEGTEDRESGVYGERERERGATFITERPGDDTITIIAVFPHERHDVSPENVSRAKFIVCGNGKKRVLKHIRDMSFQTTLRSRFSESLAPLDQVPESPLYAGDRRIEVQTANTLSS
ncbi:hypothetical protein KIPB_012232 [Kipferlia bialata]|uniref:Uncharacterized protein n=1 Tax=Kipferlia bialata TaxID=797122 RepID=A0A9K3D753_9EUKA|nr:hypothetical protein KIPB_012232 [Kipferlia bialata]|eukprot:g12232.t1